MEKVEKAKLMSVRDAAEEEFHKCSRKTCTNCSLVTMKWCVAILLDNLKKREGQVAEFEKVDLRTIDAQGARRLLKQLEEVYIENDDC